MATQRYCLMGDLKMISYRDMTFCKFYKTCADAAECPRPLTPEVRADADEWWGKGKDKAPICMYTQKPSCHKTEADLLVEGDDEYIAEGHLKW